MPETQKVHNVFEMKVAYITLGYVICMQSSVASCFAYRFVFLVIRFWYWWSSNLVLKNNCISAKLPPILLILLLAATYAKFLQHKLQYDIIVHKNWYSGHL